MTACMASVCLLAAVRCPHTGHLNAGQDWPYPSKSITLLCWAHVQEYVSALSNLLPSGQAELGQAAKDKVQQLINEAVRALPSMAHLLC